MTVAHLESIRTQSLKKASELGYSVNDRLPLLDELRVHRQATDVVDRLFAMYSLAACAYGFERQKSMTWLDQQGGNEMLSQAERHFLDSGVGDRLCFIHQIEGMWALAWCINVVSDLDFDQPCSQDFVGCLPDLKTNRSGASFRDQARLRPDAEIVARCDLAYCLHWSIVSAELQGQNPPGSVKSYIVIERRRALEWMLTDTPWEEISLDT